MATHYSLEDNGKQIIFWTNNKELHDDIYKYIRNSIDAIQWRSRVDQVKYIEEEEEYGD